MNHKNNYKKLSLFIFVPFLCLATSGCQTLKDNVGAYVKDALQDSITKDIDSKLASRQTSIAELQSNLSLSQPNLSTDLIKAVVVAEAEKLKEKSVSRDEFDSHTSRFWKWVLGLLAGLILKVAHAFKTDRAYENRLKEVEKLLGAEDEGEGSTESEDGAEREDNNGNVVMDTNTDDNKDNEGTT